jgi:hypothetical protein
MLVLMTRPAGYIVVLAALMVMTGFVSRGVASRSQYTLRIFDPLGLVKTEVTTADLSAQLGFAHR